MGLVEYSTRKALKKKMRTENILDVWMFNITKLNNRINCIY